MIRLKFRDFFVLLVVSVLGAGCASRQAVDPMGAYRLEDGRLLSIRKSVGKTLRYRVYDSGESRRLHPAGDRRYVAGPGFSAKSPIELVVEFDVDGTGRTTGLSWTLLDRQKLSAERISNEEWLTFEGDGATLFGRLDLPAGPGPYPAVVLVHGSGDDAATDYSPNGDFLAAHGIATLTYDKRGTGRSTGRYSFDFHLLARDVVAAVEYLQSRPEIDSARIGLSGYSQGTWVAPLAASQTDGVRYVVAHYGLIGSPAEEARVETRNTLRKRGVDETSLEQLDELTEASVRIVASDFRDGWKELAEIKRKYKDAAWMKQLEGTVVGKFVSYPRWLVKLLGRRRTPEGLPWYYDSSEVLDMLSMPMLWLLAEADESAPIELTLPALRRLQADGKPYEIVVFPGADHTMLLFTEESGERVHTGYAPDYFRTEVEAARRLSGLD